jgi:hypothetical protein
MSQYQPKPEEKDYVHINVTKKQGQAITPKVEIYHPVNVPAVMGLHGFEGEIVYDPRTAAQKAQVAPPNDTVKATEPLTDADSYRARYKQLFHEDAPFNLNADEVKRIVERAEAQLAYLAKGIEPVEPETDEQDAPDGLPTNKAGWFALFQQTFPGDATAYEDITVAVIREKLGK